MARLSEKCIKDNNLLLFKRMGKSAKFASVRKVGLKNTEARLSTDR